MKHNAHKLLASTFSVNTTNRWKWIIDRRNRFLQQNQRNRKKKNIFFWTWYSSDICSRRHAPSFAQNQRLIGKMPVHIPNIIHAVRLACIQALSIQNRYRNEMTVRLSGNHNLLAVIKFTHLVNRYLFGPEVMISVLIGSFEYETMRWTRKTIDFISVDFILHHSILRYILFNVLNLCPKSYSMSYVYTLYQAVILMLK